MDRKLKNINICCVDGIYHNNYSHFIITKKSVKNMKNIQFLQDFSRESIVALSIMMSNLCDNN